MENELGPAGFFVDLVDFHVVAERLHECDELRVVVDAPSCQGDVKD